MRTWWAIIILMAISLGAAAFPRPDNKPLTQDDILYLLNNYVPSAECDESGKGKRH